MVEETTKRYLVWADGAAAIGDREEKKHPGMGIPITEAFIAGALKDEPTADIRDALAYLEEKKQKRNESMIRRFRARFTRFLQTRTALFLGMVIFLVAIGYFFRNINPM